jgi:hypothetical protein
MDRSFYDFFIGIRDMNEALVLIDYTIYTDMHPFFAPVRKYNFKLKGL